MRNPISWFFGFMLLLYMTLFCWKLASCLVQVTITGTDGVRHFQITPTGVLEKATPVGGDYVLILDSAGDYKLKKAQSGNLPNGGWAGGQQARNVSVLNPVTETLGYVPYYHSKWGSNTVVTMTQWLPRNEIATTDYITRTYTPSIYISDTYLREITNGYWLTDRSAVNIHYGNITATAVTQHEGSITHDNIIAGTIASHDTGALGSQLDTLTDGSDADSLHDHGTFLTQAEIVALANTILDSLCSTNGQILKRTAGVWICSDDETGGGGVSTFFALNGDSDLIPLTSGGGGTIFEYNGDSDITPLASTGTDTYFEYNGDGDITPKA
jgi:hypothetical protein